MNRARLLPQFIIRQCGCYHWGIFVPDFDRGTIIVDLHNPDVEIPCRELAHLETYGDCLVVINTTVRIA